MKWSLLSGRPSSFQSNGNLKSYGFHSEGKAGPNIIPHSLAGKPTYSKPDHASHFLPLFLCSNMRMLFQTWERWQQQPFNKAEPGSSEDRPNTQMLRSQNTNHENKEEIKSNKINICQIQVITSS